MNGKVCRVCEDKASGLNYNVQTCDSCKVFFCRYADRHNKLLCRKKAAKCLMNITNRKGCLKCRLDKCIAVGMKKKLKSLNPKKVNKTNSLEIEFFVEECKFVKIENFIKSNIRKYLETIDISNELTFENDFMKTLTKRNLTKQFELTDYEMELIREVQNAVSSNFKDESAIVNVRMPKGLKDSFGRPDLYANMIAKYCKFIPAYNRLNCSDQFIVFKSACFDLMAIRCSFVYNAGKNGFTLIENESGSDGYFFGLDIFNQLNKPDCVDFIRKVSNELHDEMENDDKIRDLLSTQLLFKPRLELSNNEFIRYHEKRYSRLLFRYLEFKYQNKIKANNKYYALMSLVSNFDLCKTYEVILFQEVKNLSEVPHIYAEMYDLVF